MKIRKRINGIMFSTILLTTIMPFTGCSQSNSTGSQKKGSTIVPMQRSKDEKVYTGNVKLHTQQEINEFGKHQYAFIAGSLEVEPATTNYSDEVLDTRPLESIRVVDGSLLITKFRNLVSTDGLRNLEKVNGDFVISGCGLRKIDAINKLSVIKGGLVFGNNTGDAEKGLEVISGFEGLKEVKYIAISGNALVTKLDAFNNIEVVDKVSVSDTKIAAFNSFRKLKTVKEVFLVEHNPALTSVSLEQLETVGEMFGLYDNRHLNGNIHLPKIQQIKDLYIYQNESFENYCDVAGLIRNGKIKTLHVENNKVDLTEEKILKQCK